MLGAIIGDIVGSTYEFHNTNNYNFELFPVGSSFTDDTICTIAVADAILRHIPYRDSILEWCRKYPFPKGGYGGSFARWVFSNNPQPYDSFGNGAAMRVSPIGYAFDSALEALAEGKKSAECSHSHAEGIWGAQVTALIVYLIRSHDWSSPEVFQVVCNRLYGEDYASNLPKVGVWNETCQGCVPLAMHLFSTSTSFEDAIRKAVSYGGDSDTLGAIVGSFAGAYYGIPKLLEERARSFLPQEMLDVMDKFNQQYINND